MQTLYRPSTVHHAPHHVRILPDSLPPITHVPTPYNPRLPLPLPPTYSPHPTTHIPTPTTHVLPTPYHPRTPYPLSATSTHLLPMSPPLPPTSPLYTPIPPTYPPPTHPPTTHVLLGFSPQHTKRIIVSSSVFKDCLDLHCEFRLPKEARTEYNNYIRAEYTVIMQLLKEM
ncbi:hypothetical protein Pcinc_041627 [Petrolisthes cinctipes]|uniref:Uncharacterized protein n=1 Tax=Petrolisthes cinctipes TaxID=88211 RepID=A0AAE1BJ80_PETCI|nr:hypothetical protein Pcinc_041627 [Petrolisthes cinctipes]